MRGRFAPTPSGPLHAGSIVAAVGSWLDARARGGEWHLRIDDLDPPRVAPGAIDAILRALDTLGLHPDGPVVFQSRRTEAYAQALERLRERAHVYRCTCSRTRIAAAGLTGIEGPRYPGTCRTAGHGADAPGADRIAVDATPIVFDDLDLGPVAQDLSQAVGDFVLRRADGVFAYHLACVVDDAEAGFTDVVRGADLAASTPRQIALQRLLRLPTPRYRHLPVVLDADGAKLSKQTRAAPVDLRAPAATLVRALTFLGVGPDAPIAADTPPTHVLADAVPRWRHRVAPHAAA